MLSKVLFFLLCVLTRLRRFDLFFTPKNYKTLHKMCILRNVAYWLNLTTPKISHKKISRVFDFFRQKIFSLLFFAFLQIYVLRPCAYMYIYFLYYFFLFLFFPTVSSLSFHFSPKKHKKKKRIFFLRSSKFLFKK